VLAAIEDRCDAIEECYEFMLGYAGKGLSGEESGESSEVRRHLQEAAQALNGLAHVLSDVVERQRLEPGSKYRAFLAVIDRDARDSLAAVELVLAQQAISSQLIDNLNASIHLRALLTDLFLIDEILRAHIRHQDPLLTS
jgi:hypothetical protein